MYFFYFSDAEKAIEFLSKQKEKVKANHDAQVLCLTAIGNLKLSEKKLKETKVRCSHQNTCKKLGLSSQMLAMVETFSTGNSNFLAISQEIIEEVNALLENIDGITTVHARFYDLSSGYDKVRLLH